MLLRCVGGALRNLWQHLSYKDEIEEPINNKKVGGRFCIPQGKLRQRKAINRQIT